MDLIYGHTEPETHMLHIYTWAASKYLLYLFNELSSKLYICLLKLSNELKMKHLPNYMKVNI